MANPTWDDTEEVVTLKQDSAVPTWDDTAPTWDETSEVEGEYTMADSAARGAVQGFTLGFADEGAAAAEQVWESAKILSTEGFKEGYQEKRDAIRQADYNAQQENPGSYLAGEVAGAIAVPIPGAAAARTVGAVAKQGAKLGAAYGAGASDADLTEGEYLEAATDTAIGGVAGAAGGAALAKGVPVLVNAVKGIPGKVGQVVADSVPVRMVKTVEDVFKSNAGQHKNFMNTPVKELVAKTKDNIANATPADLAGLATRAGTSAGLFLLNPGLNVALAGGVLAVRKIAPLAVKHIGPHVKRYGADKLVQMGSGVRGLMTKGGDEIKAYLPAFETATSAMGIGGAGVIHAHLLKTNPEYRRLVKEELKAQGKETSLLFN